MDDDTAGSIEAGHPQVAADNRLDVAAGSRHAPDVCVAVVLDREEQRLAVPDRLADRRIRSALAIELLGQDAPLARRHVHDRDAVMARPVEAAGTPVTGDPRAVGRPRREVVVVVVGRDAAWLFAGGVHDPDLLAQLHVPVVVARGDERQLLRVGRPCRGVVLEVAVGQLLRLRGAIGRHDEDVRATVAGPPHGVELVAVTRETAGQALLVVLLLVGRVRDARCERKPCAIGRPHGLGHVLLEIRQAQRLAAVERQHVELLVIAVAVGGEGEPPAVGRPARRAVRLLAGGQLPRGHRAVGRGQPDRTAIGVLVPVDRVDGIGDRLPVRGEARVRRPDDVVEVLRAHERGAYTLATRISRVSRESGSRSQPPKHSTATKPASSTSRASSVAV